MKATIDATGDVYVIRLYEKGALCDIHVVEEVEVIGDSQSKHEFMFEHCMRRPQYAG